MQSRWPLVGRVEELKLLEGAFDDHSCRGLVFAGPPGVGKTVLTPREAEIAALAARDLSDRQIADRLVVSVRTVENHLQHTYAKLGIPGRKDLAQALPPVH